MKDVTPPGLGLSCFWHGIGMGPGGKVYVGISTGAHLRGEPGDVLIFEYDTASEERRFLAGVREILRGEGNLAPGESVAKVHSDLLEHDGKLYFSTHDWSLVDAVSDHRGGHFLSFDPATGRFRDLSKSQRLGVSVAGEGIIAMNVLRERQELVGWTIPFGNVVIHGLTTARTTVYAGGLDPADVRNVARVVLATANGDVFAAYEHDPAVAGSDRLLKLSRETGRLLPTGERFSSTGRFEGLAETSDGRTVYLADWDGDLYAFEVERERLEPLGSLLPTHREGAVGELFNLALSPDDRKLFTVPYSMRHGEGAYHLYEYDVATGTRADVEDLSPLLEGCTPTGNGVFDDRGRYTPTTGREATAPESSGSTSAIGFRSP